MGTQANKKITAIKPTARHPHRAVICVNGKTVATLPYHTITQLGLAIDQNLDEKALSAIQENATYEKAYQAALSRLNRVATSTRDLATRLRLKGYPQATITRVTDRLTELGLLDDKAYGEALIRTTVARKPAGARLLRATLQKRGLEAGVIDQLLEETAPNPDQAIDQAAELAKKKLATMSHQLPTPARRRRLWGLLARRGFTPDTIEPAVERAMSYTDLD